MVGKFEHYETRDVLRMGDVYTDKKKRKFSSNIRKFRMEQLQNLYEEGFPNIRGNAQICNHKRGGC
jgi:hypothetical protein